MTDLTSPPLDYTADLEALRKDVEAYRADWHARMGSVEVLDRVLAHLADNARMREVLEEREASRSQPGAACPSDCAENGPLRSDGWRDIASAPKDAYALVYSDAYKWHGLGGLALAYRHTSYNGHRDVWTLDGRAGRPVSGKSAPTHWMPLPTPPSDDVGGEG